MARRRRRSGRRRAGRRECGARPRPVRQGGFGARGGGGVQPRIGAARDVRAAAGRQPRRCSCAPAMRRRKERGKGSERMRRAWGSSPQALFGWRWTGAASRLVGGGASRTRRSRGRRGVEGTRGGRGSGSMRCRGGRSRGRERRRGRRRSEAARWTIGGRRQSREEGGMEEERPGLKYPKPLAPGDNFKRYLRAP